jgi:hypothetical protein
MGERLIYATPRSLNHALSHTTSLITKLRTHIGCGKTFTSNNMMFHNTWEVMFHNFLHVAKQKRWYDTRGYVWGLKFKV